MMSKEIFAVVFLVLTGCLSAMALHTGNLPKNINKRESGNSVCPNNQQVPNLVTVDENVALPLSEVHSKVTRHTFESALFTEGAAANKLPETLKISKVSGSSNYEMTSIKYNAMQSNCTEPEIITLKPVSSEASKAVFRYQKNTSTNDYYLFVIFSSCENYIWRYMCESPFDGNSYECPKDSIQLDLFFDANLALERAPMKPIASDLDGATNLYWGIADLNWIPNRANNYCALG